MAYCRWSSDDFKCDLYVYESDWGYTIHIASNRVVGDIPKLKEVNDPDFLESYNAQMKYLSAAKYKQIKLPMAGESMDCSTPEELLAELLLLRETGYNFPDYVLKIVGDEIEERAKGEGTKQ